MYTKVQYLSLSYYTSVIVPMLLLHDTVVTFPKGHTTHCCTWFELVLLLLGLPMCRTSGHNGIVNDSNKALGCISYLLIGMAQNFDTKRPFKLRSTGSLFKGTKIAKYPSMLCTSVLLPLHFHISSLCVPFSIHWQLHTSTARLFTQKSCYTLIPWRI